MKHTSLIALLLAAVMLLGMLAGCSSKPAQTPAPDSADTPAASDNTDATDKPDTDATDEPDTGTTDEPAGPESDESSDAPTLEDQELTVDNTGYHLAEKINAAMTPASTKTLPLADDGASFTCWWPSDLSAVSNYNETAFFQWMEEKTGVHLEFDNPSSQSAATQYNLMLVSGDVCDMVRQLYIYHTKGLDNAVDDDWFYNMLELKDDMPNMFDRLENDRELYLQTLTDSGYIAGLPMLMSESEDWVNGLMVRKDWLDKYDLDVPRTYDELHDMLTIFHDNEDAVSEGPLWMNNLCFTGIEGGFGIPGFNSVTSEYRYIIRDGEIHYYVLEEGYREYIETMRQWYSEGLVNRDFASESLFIAAPNRDKWLNGAWAVTYDCFVYLDEQNALAREYDPNFTMVPMSVPVKNEGDTVHTLQPKKQCWQGALGISKTCENVELACSYWDFLYAGEGMIYANYGEEGVTMEYGEDGIPHYNEFGVYGNEEFPSANQIQNYFMLLDGPYYRIGGRTADTMTPEELACGPAWCNGDPSYQLPANLTLTSDEGERVASIMSDIDTYVTENQAKYIVGDQSMDSFDSFLETVKSMGIDEVIDIYTDALSRYNERGKLIP